MTVDRSFVAENRTERVRLETLVTRLDDAGLARSIETVRWEYPEKTVVLHFYRCRLERGAIEPREGQAVEWVAPARLNDYEFPPADLALITRLRVG